MRQEELPGGVLKVALDGSFDIAGAGDVDLRFSVIGGSRKKVLVDFSKVSFLASMGVRVLVKTAKALGNHGGKLVVVNANEPSRKVLNATGADTIIPVVETEADAITRLG